VSLSDVLFRARYGYVTAVSESTLKACFGTFAPKHLHNGLKTIELSNYLAVGIFNNGFLSILKMFSVMGIIIGSAARDYAADRDETRLRLAEYRHQAASKEGRLARRKASATQQVLFEEEEGELYGPGLAD
ncbi:Uncharacterized protein DBV15_12978, partial [Temnothorax longispinosus]